MNGPSYPGLGHTVSFLPMGRSPEAARQHHTSEGYPPFAEIRIGVQHQ